MLAFKFILILIVIIIISILLIKRFIYFSPDKTFLPYNTERYKDVSINNLHGWFIEGGPKIVIICHGNAGNISHRQHLIDSIYDLGYSVLIFDYSGYGKSQGIPSETQLYKDASLFINMMLEKTNKDNLIMYGESIGAPIAAYIARKYQINTLIIDSGLPSIKKFMKSKFGVIGSLLGFIFPEFDTESYLNGYTGRTLLMHSPTDEVIHINSIEILKMYATQFISIHGTHNSRVIPWNKVKQFIEGV